MSKYGLIVTLCLLFLKLSGIADHSLTWFWVAAPVAITLIFDLILMIAMLKVFMSATERKWK